MGLALLSAVSLPLTAQANIVTDQPLGQFDVVLLDKGQGTELLGDVNNVDNVIRFSSSQTLVAAASGQASLTGLNTGITNLTIDTVSPYLGFEALQFNLRGDTGTTVSFTAFDQFGTAFLSSGTLDNNGNGANRFTFTTDSTQYIRSVSFLASAGVSVDTVEQVRIGSLVSPTAVPGPVAGAGFPVLMALGGFVWARRRKAVTA